MTYPVNQVCRVEIAVTISTDLWRSAQVGDEAGIIPLPGVPQYQASQAD
jgi:hypothetical protein